MPINSDKPHLWKADVAQSIDFYNDSFLRFAPGTYRKQLLSAQKKFLQLLRKSITWNHNSMPSLRDGFSAADINK